jgi:hypothetical protein
MFNQHFGQYLLAKGLLPAKQLAEAIEYSSSVSRKLGVIAIDAGLLTAKQVEEIVRQQRIQDKLFGELATELGFLTNAQLDSLLEMQYRQQSDLGHALVDKGFFTLEQYETILKDYREEARLNDDRWRELLVPDFKSANRLVIDFSAEGELAEFYYEYIALLERNMVRSLHEIPVVEKPVPIRETGGQWLIQQGIGGKYHILTGLLMDDRVLVEVAGRFAGETLTEIDDFTKDSAAEFLNVANGLFCVDASNQGIELELQLQKLEKCPAPLPVQGYAIPIIFPFGKLYLILSVGKK